MPGRDKDCGRRGRRPERCSVELAGRPVGLLRAVVLSDKAAKLFAINEDDAMVTRQRSGGRDEARSGHKDPTVSPLVAATQPLLYKDQKEVPLHSIVGSSILIIATSVLPTLPSVTPAARFTD